VGQPGRLFSIDDLLLTIEYSEMDPDELNDRINNFAHRCVKLALALPQTVLGNHIRGQLIRCSTSAAANYRAVCIAQSKPHFVSKLSIVMEECDESCFWMKFIIDEQLLKKKRVLPLLQEGRELTSIRVSSRKTARGISKKL
jgi:four helix bundle protein